VVILLKVTDAMVRNDEIPVYVFFAAGSSLLIFRKNGDIWAGIRLP